jgi:threonine dehydratase
MVAHPAITREAIAGAFEVIRPHVRRTPLIDVDLGDFGLPRQPAALKLEFLQHSGSFKARGAFVNLLTRSIGPSGVAAASGGNHGAAVAYAAHQVGVPASIFVPDVSPQAKREKIAGYGARLVVEGARYAEALAACEDFVARSGAASIHAYDQIETMLGQGTVGAELEEQRPDIDTLLVAVGGGGLIGGIAAWYEGRVKVVAVEPEAAPTLHMALAAGRPIDAPAGGIAADSLAPRQVGEMMFPGPIRVVGSSADSRRARRSSRLCSASLRTLPACGRRTCRCFALRRKYRRCQLRLSAGHQRPAALVCGRARGTHA